MDGFTYNGVHCSAFGLYYIPNGDDRWFSDPEYDVYDADVDWRDGGYYYGSKLKNKTFTIKCYFEEIDIAMRQRIKQWVKRGTKGMLIFDDMPFVYWNVRPGKIPVGNWYNDLNDSHSGTVTLTFVAYEPFGYLTRKSNPSYANDNAEDYCNFIDSEDMPDAPTTNSTRFNVYNPGTEDCGLSIEISGTTENPFRFFNEQNGTFCAFESMPSNNLIVRVDGDTGYVKLTINEENGFAYHDKGVVRLSPNHGRENIGFEYLGMNGTLHGFELTGMNVSNDLIGAELFVDGMTNTTFTVSSVMTTTNRVYCIRSGSDTPDETGTCKVIDYNSIVIQEKINNAWVTPSTLTLNSISIDYIPRIM